MAAEDVVSGCSYYNLKRESAVAEVRARFNESYSETKYYSCKLPVSAIRSAMYLAAPQSHMSLSSDDCLGAFLDKLWMSELGGVRRSSGLHALATRWVALTVVQPRVEHQVLAAKGKLARGDIGVSLHWILDSFRDVGEMVVAITPATLQAMQLGDFPASHCALVLSLQDLTLESLEGLVQWESTSGMPLCMSKPEDSDAALGRTAVQEILPKLMRDGGVCLPPDGGDYSQLIELWQSLNYVVSEDTGSDTGHRRWRMTDLGEKQVVVGVRLTRPHRLLVPPAGDPKEFRLYNLFQALEADGWTCEVVDSKEELRRIKDSPYIAGESSKVFYLNGARVHCAADVDRDYLICLLLAAQHQNPVPHCAASSVYNLLLDPGWQPRKRRRRCIASAPPPLALED